MDRFGRECTQVLYGSGVALDCDGRPVESRLGEALDRLASPSVAP